MLCGDVEVSYPGFKRGICLGNCVQSNSQNGVLHNLENIPGAFKTVPHISMWEIKTWSTYIKFIGFPISSSLGSPFAGLLLLSSTQLEAQNALHKLYVLSEQAALPMQAKDIPRIAVERHGPGKRLMLTHMPLKSQRSFPLNRFHRHPTCTNNLIRAVVSTTSHNCCIPHLPQLLYRFVAAGSHKCFIDSSLQDPATYFFQSAPDVFDFFAGDVSET